MATGGTIAGSGAGAASSGVYNAGSIGVAALIDGEFLLLKIPVSTDSLSRARPSQHLQHLRISDRKRRLSVHCESRRSYK
jgi:hypothetical protein